jgi:hypothetical protein
MREEANQLISRKRSKRDSGWYKRRWLEETIVVEIRRI